VLVITFLPVILPLIAIISFLVAVDSRGPIFYCNHRIGKNGVVFRKWKFRSMVPNADEILIDYQNNYPEMREEWNISQKLKNDPRVTRMGHFLRKYSLDELPQLWNVFIGDMSLVGPRPIADAEQYGNCYNLYKHVRPGLTGLWQVSGRNDIPFSERIRMDEYYIRNWSIWLDMIILARTPEAVIKGRGAY
jgi:lipopolysaccharide/colanic/teichoic acid biosynthesis glycosyltransferase